jgi:hypothetical protein
MRASRRLAAIAWVSVCAAAGSLPLRGAVQALPEPAIAQLLDRVSAYVDAFERELAGITIEEDYTQQSLPGARQPQSRTRSRRLRSDLLMVHLPAEDRWIQFRDVFEVDGRAVRDRDERLAQLFLSPSDSALTQAENIALESARYNLGAIHRTVNLPVLAMSYLSARHRHRSVFSAVEPGNTKAIAGLASARDIQAIRFEETQPQTLIRTEGDGDLPANGRAWIDGTTGRILKTELIAQNARVRGRVEVTYRIETGVDVLVPAEMREEYGGNAGASRIVGRARYGKLKRFTVTTETTLRKPPGQQ